jgi:hypothetical protein
MHRFMILTLQCNRLTMVRVACSARSDRRTRHHLTTKAAVNRRCGEHLPRSINDAEFIVRMLS